MKRNFAECFLSLLLLVNSITLSQTTHTSQEHNFNLEELTNELEFPWGLDFLPDGDILVTEKYKGTLRLIKGGKLIQTPIEGLPKNIYHGGQGGLLDVLVHPNYLTNGLIFLSYSGLADGGNGTEVIRARYDGRKLLEVKKIFSAWPKTSGSHHFGSRMAIATDGTLFITLGDRYHKMKEAQDPSNHFGSVVRINIDGTIPENNPFIKNQNYRKEIFSFGHRNGQGLAVRPSDGTIWMHEHGPRGGDELNLLDKPGSNYGWPAITYGIDYSGATISEKTSQLGMEQPIAYWVPSIAPCGMAFYESESFPRWKGDLFIGALAGQHLRRLRLKDKQVIKQEVLLNGFARIRDVGVGPDGLIYLITDSNQGQLLRLKPITKLDG